jgi:hypothetical protein
MRASCRFTPAAAAAADILLRHAMLLLFALMPLPAR